jgi:hypothetical protein
MKPIIPLAIALLFLTIVSTGQQQTRALKLDFFSKIPSAIDGCSGLYTYDTILTKKKKYIIVTDLQELAFIRINGKEIKLTRISNKELPKQTYVSKYSGDGYTVILTTKTGKQTGDEVYSETGSIEVIKGTEKIMIKIHGESGC